jgi:hypothetical protein
LLEQHHKQLGQILKFRHEHPQSSEKLDNHDNDEEVETTERSPDPPAEDTSRHLTSLEALQQPPRLARGTRATARDLSSSIASNLASARGIPGGQRRAIAVSPTISAQHVPGKFSKEQAGPRGAPAPSKASKLQPGFFSSNDRLDEGRPSWAPPAHVTNDERANVPSPTGESAASVNDAPFQQFYNTLESLMSKLSAPLAFAGLPLVSNASPISQPEKPAKLKEPPASAGENNIDYSQLISKAALRAVQDGQSSVNPAESFYVVPTTGGTTSYADIMTRANRGGSTLRHTRHLSNLSEDNMEDFVDAKETLPPATKLQNPEQTLHAPSKFQNPAARQPAIHNKYIEELTIQNAENKKTIDNLSTRLHVFEASAQSSSAALAYSIRSIARSQPGTPDNSQGKTPTRDEKAAASRIAELEEMLRRNDRELARQGRENVKLKETVGRYREKWEKLKEGARARRGDGGGMLGKAEEGSAATNSAE